jgi:hypothetical protein
MRFATMRKVLVVFVALVAYRSSAQVEHGTVVILNFSKDKLIVAADSRGSDSNNDRPPDDSQCKLAQLNHRILFTTTGAVGHPGTLLIPAWNNMDVAISSMRSAVAAAGGQADIETVSAYWAKALKDKWQGLYVENSAQVIRAAEIGNGTITVGFFAQAKEEKIDWGIVLVTFDRMQVPPIQVVWSKDLAYCWPCGQSSARLCAGGQVAVPTQFCSALDSAKASVGRNRRRKLRLDEELLTIGAGKMTAACDLTGSVGGPIDAIELTTKGEFRWLRRKSNCPENQD